MSKRPAPKPAAAPKRGHKAPTHPYRAWHGTGNRRERDPETIVPFHGRLVRR